MSRSLIAAIAITGFAGVPDFVIDEANVLSEEDELAIEKVNAVIYEQTGSRFLIMTVDFLGGKTIEQFCSDVYHQNNLGDNGLLLVISVAEENYHVIQGEQLESDLSNELLNMMLETTIEQPFKQQDYSSAIMGFHKAAAEKLGEIYDAMIDPEQYKLWLEEQQRIEEKRISDRKKWFIAMGVSAAIALLFTIRMIVTIAFRKSRRKRMKG